MAKVKISKLNRAITKLIDSSIRAIIKAERICGSADALAKKIGAGRKCYDCWRNGDTRSQTHNQSI